MFLFLICMWSKRYRNLIWMNWKLSPILWIGTRVTCPLRRLLNFTQKKKIIFSCCGNFAIFAEHTLQIMFEKDPLMQFAGIPVSGATIRSCFPDLASPEKKVQALEKSGELIRLKRNLFIINKELTGKETDARLCGNSYAKWPGRSPLKVIHHVLSGFRLTQIESIPDRSWLWFTLLLV